MIKAGNNLVQALPGLTICVGTFGDRVVWAPMAARALGSVSGQTVRVRRSWGHIDDPHPHNCGKARNLAAEMAETEWLLFLDADDELAPDACERLLEAAASTPGDIYVPAMSYYRNGVWEPPGTLTPRPVHKGWWGPVGAMIRRADFECIGRFREDLPWGEDVELFLRAERAGLTFVPVQSAVYRIHWREGSRKFHPQNDRLWNLMVRGQL